MEQGQRPAINLYHGKVMHARLKPFGHRFFYKVYSIFLDLNRLEEADKASRLFSVNRFNLLSFYEKDHGSKGEEPLLAYVCKVAEAAGLAQPTRVWLSAFPRVLGYVFNPLSIYFLQNEHGDTYAHLYEVRNTFGGMHTYVVDIEKHGLKHSSEKLFHVSPFLERNLFYTFYVTTPQETLNFKIVEKNENGEVVLTALQTGHHEPLSSNALLRFGLGFPFMSLKVILGIHWEALKLYVKGARLKPDFAHPTNHSVDGQFLTIEKRNGLQK